MTFFSFGDCPVCSDLGSLVVLRSASSEVMVLWCPMCETAWHQHPRGRVETIHTLEDLVPEGVTQPSKLDVDLYAEKLGVESYSPVVNWNEELKRLISRG